jgi:hypothetical protein
MGRSCSEKNGEAERVRGLVIESLALSPKIFLGMIFHKPLKKLGISLFQKDIKSVSPKFDELLEKFLVEHEEKMEEDHYKANDMMDLLLEAMEMRMQSIKSQETISSPCSWNFSLQALTPRR